MVFGAAAVAVCIGVSIGIPSCLTPSLESITKTCLYKASVAQLDAPSDWRPGGRGFNPR